jgi:hypothetical protein
MPVIECLLHEEAKVAHSDQQASVMSFWVTNPPTHHSRLEEAVIAVTTEAVSLGVYCTAILMVTGRLPHTRMGGVVFMRQLVEQECLS